jgi:hypothetical protein
VLCSKMSLHESVSGWTTFGVTGRMSGVITKAASCTRL